MTIPNRVLVPAMVTRLSGEDGFVNQPIIDRYVRYAEGHVGLIVVEATAIHGAKSGPLLRISDDQFVAGHRELVRRVHDAGPSKIVPQIIHFMKVARSGWRQTIDMLDARGYRRDRRPVRRRGRAARARRAMTASSCIRRTPTPSPRSCRGTTSAATNMTAARSRAGCACSAA